MSSEFNTNPAKAVDSLLDRLTDLALNSEIETDIFLRQAIDTIEEMLASKQAIVVTTGPSQSWIWVAGTKGSESLLSERLTTAPKQTAEPNDADSKLIQSAFKEEHFCVSPIRISSAPWGWLIVELEPNSHGKSMLPLIDAISEVLATHIRSRPLSGTNDEGSVLDDFFQFSLHAHASLQPRQVAAILADDLRLFFSCERVSLFGVTGKSPRLLAISAVSKIESRTRLIRDMKSLVKLAATNGIAFTSDIGQTDEELSRGLDAYRAQTEFDVIAGIPLQATSLGEKNHGEIVGYLLLESNGGMDRLEFARRLKLAIPHVSLSLLNAKKFSCIPFHRLLSRGFGRFSFTSMLKTVVGLVLITAFLFALTITQSSFNVRINGELRPPDERLVFTPNAGIVKKVFVNHGDQVTKSQILLEVQSPELDLEIQQAQAEIRKLNTLRESLVISINQEATGNAGDRVVINQLTAEVADLDRQLEARSSKLDFLMQQKTNLQIPSPIAGRITSWEIKRFLTNKPVQWGEALLNVANEEGDWRLIFKVPEHRIGYILRASNENKEPLRLEYSFDSNPGKKYSGTISSIARSTDSDAREGSYVVIEGVPDSQNFPKRHGSKVYATVHCGSRSMLFIWTHELVDSIRRQFVW